MLPTRRELLIAVVCFCLGFLAVRYLVLSGPAYDNVDEAAVVDGPGPIAAPYDADRGVDRIISSQAPAGDRP